MSRQVLDRASALALWMAAGALKAVENHRIPKRCRDFLSSEQFLASCSKKVF
jgi:hypothetical protein